MPSVVFGTIGRKFITLDHRVDHRHPLIIGLLSRRRHIRQSRCSGRPQLPNGLLGCLFHESRRASLSHELVPSIMRTMGESLLPNERQRVHLELRTSTEVEIPPFHWELVRGGADGVVIVRDGVIVPRGDHRRELRELLHVVRPLDASALVPASLDRVEQSRARDVADGEPGARYRRSPALQVEPIVGISEPELHPIRVIAIALLRRSLGHSQFASAHGVITCHHRSLGADRIDLASDLEGHDRDLPADEHGDDDGRPEPTIARGPDQDLVAELLLNGQISIRAIASEHPVEQDLIPIEDLDVHIGSRRIEHDRPSERLEGRVR